jgi:cytochrome b subunit of formate dehydrogenase
MVTGSDKHCFSFQSCGITLAVHHLYKISVIEGSLEVKLPTAWPDEKQRREGKKKENQKEKEEKRREEERRSKKRKSQKEEDPSRETLCFSNDLWPRRVEK